MIKKSDLLNLFERMLREHWAYQWGAGLGTGSGCEPVGKLSRDGCRARPAVERSNRGARRLSDGRMDDLDGRESIQMQTKCNSLGPDVLPGAWEVGE